MPRWAGSGRPVTGDIERDRRGEASDTICCVLRMGYAVEGLCSGALGTPGLFGMGEGGSGLFERSFIPNAAFTAIRGR